MNISLLNVVISTSETDPTDAVFHEESEYMDFILPNKTEKFLKPKKYVHLFTIKNLKKNEYYRPIKKTRFFCQNVFKKN